MEKDIAMKGNEEAVFSMRVLVPKVGEELVKGISIVKLIEVMGINFKITEKTKEIGEDGDGI